jgi:hypothetical protein
LFSARPELHDGPVHTIDRYEQLLVPGTARLLDVPPYLNAAERDLYLACRSKNLRLEQERLPQADVVAALSESPVAFLSTARSS